MESKIFAKLNFDPGILVILSLVISAVLVVVVIMLFLRLSRLQANYRIFMRGKNARSLQESLKQELGSIDDIKEQMELLHKRLSYVERSLNKSFQKCGIVKYDAFRELSGQLSFACALLNDSNTGFVINCIHSREGSYTYIKDIVRGECSLPLCDEEMQAVENAVKASTSHPAETIIEKKDKNSKSIPAASSSLIEKPKQAARFFKKTIHPSTKQTSETVEENSEEK